MGKNKTAPVAWERFGNSVPPVMMAAIATSIRDGILS